MARPQLEDGYTQIANEILEGLMRIQLPANQWQALLCIIRKTWGWHKKVDRIANFQICEATGLSKTVVSRALRKLEDAEIIYRNGKSIGFQKDWQKWKLAERSTITKTRVSRTANKKLTEQPTELAEQSTKVSSSRVTQKKKETIQNKTLKKDTPTTKNKNFLTPEKARNIYHIDLKGEQSKELPPEMKALVRQKQKTIETLKHQQEQEQGYEITLAQHNEILQRVDEAIMKGKLNEILVGAKG